MGRTQKTRRLQLHETSDRMILYISDNKLRGQYRELWDYAYNLTGPTTELLNSDSKAIATFNMLVAAIKKLDQIKEEVKNYSSSSSSN